MKILKVRLTPARLVVLSSLLLVTCIMAAAVAVMTPPTYTAKAEAVLIGPSLNDNGRPANPYMQLGQALGVIADVLISASGDEAAQKKILAGGGSKDYVLERPFGASEPIIDITTKAPTAGQAITTARLLMAQLSSELQSRQNAVQVAPGTRVNLVRVTSPTTASRSWKTALEYGVAAFVLGVVSAFLLTVAFDRYLRRREGGQQVPSRKTLNRPGKSLRTRVPRVNGASGSDQALRVSPPAEQPAEPSTSPPPQPTVAHRPAPIVSVRTGPRRVPNRTNR